MDKKYTWIVYIAVILVVIGFIGFILNLIKLSSHNIHMKVVNEEVDFWFYMLNQGEKEEFVEIIISNVEKCVLDEEFTYPDCNTKQTSYQYFIECNKLPKRGIISILCNNLVNKDTGRAIVNYDSPYYSFEKYYNCSLISDCILQYNQSKTKYEKIIPDSFMPFSSFFE